MTDALSWAKSHKQKITARDLVAKNPSPAVKAIYDRALKHAYRDQQALLKKAAALDKSQK